MQHDDGVTGYFKRIYRSTSHYVKNYMTASDQEMQSNTDPFMAIITAAPSDSLYFIERINLISAIISVTTSFPYLIYLFIYWNECSPCNDILRWWIVINSVLQLIQAPVRFSLYFLLRKLERENERLHIHSLRRLTCSKGWKLSKRLSLLNYLWFITGTIVMVGTRKYTHNYLWFISWTIILSCIFRVFFTIVWVSFFFPYDQNSTKMKMGVPKQFFSEVNTYKYSSDKIASKEVCSICLSDFFEKEQILELRCLHRFHLKCAKMWLSHRRQCPLCQRDVMVESEKKEE